LLAVAKEVGGEREAAKNSVYTVEAHPRIPGDGDEADEDQSCRHGQERLDQHSSSSTGASICSAEDGAEKINLHLLLIC